MKKSLLSRAIVTALFLGSTIIMPVQAASPWVDSNAKDGVISADLSHTYNIVNATGAEKFQQGWAGWNSSATASNSNAINFGNSYSGNANIVSSIGAQIDHVWANSTAIANGTTAAYNGVQCVSDVDYTTGTFKRGDIQGGNYGNTVEAAGAVVTNNGWEYWGENNKASSQSVIVANTGDGGKVQGNTYISNEVTGIGAKVQSNGSYNYATSNGDVTVRNYGNGDNTVNGVGAIVKGGGDLLNFEGEQGLKCPAPINNKAESNGVIVYNAGSSQNQVVFADASSDTLQAGMPKYVKDTGNNVEGIGAQVNTTNMGLNNQAVITGQVSAENGFRDVIKSVEDVDTTDKTAPQNYKNEVGAYGATVNGDWGNKATVNGTVGAYNAGANNNNQVYAYGAIVGDSQDMKGLASCKPAQTYQNTASAGNVLSVNYGKGSDNTVTAYGAQISSGLNNNQASVSGAVQALNGYSGCSYDYRDLSSNTVSATGASVERGSNNIAKANSDVLAFNLGASGNEVTATGAIISYTSSGNNNQATVTGSVSAVNTGFASVSATGASITQGGSGSATANFVSASNSGVGTQSTVTAVGATVQNGTGTATANNVIAINSGNGSKVTATGAIVH